MQLVDIVRYCAADMNWFHMECIRTFCIFKEKRGSIPYYIYLDLGLQCLACIKCLFSSL